MGVLNWFVLVPILLFWFLVVPVLSVLLWVVLYPTWRLCTADVPSWLDSPWDIQSALAVTFFCVRVNDCDGLHTILLPGIREMRCAVLMNHRSFGDFFVDPHAGHCAIVARTMAVVATMLAGLLGLVCNRIIVFRRGADVVAIKSNV